jgi:sn-glycerol 3-phosphate transport system substrate-binding protein
MRRFFQSVPRLAPTCALALAAALAAPSAFAQTEIQLWHAMTGALGNRVGDLADRFNKSQSDYKVVAVYKGSYPETLTAAIAAYRAGNAPHMVQVFEVGTATMMSAKGAVVPVHQLMKSADEPFNPKGYIPAVTGYYTDTKGNMLSFPFNSSTTVFYYNKDAFKRAGLDASKPPRTWKDVAAAADKLKASGEKCGYTSGWQSWVHLENTSAWHNVPFASRDNGFAGSDATLQFNSPFHVKHVSLLADMAKKGTMTYGGRRNEPEAKFFSGECAMLTSSSAAQANIRANAKFDFGVSQLPYHDDVKGAPQNTILGGASVWVMGGKTNAGYKGVARFFSFLSKAELQAEWHQVTGYVPITPGAYDVTKKSGFYDKNPGTDVSVLQMTSKAPTANSKGIRLGNFVQIRDVIDEELEGVWAGKKAPQQALDDAVRRGNELLRRFEATNKG